MFDKFKSKATAAVVGGTALVAGTSASAQTTFDNTEILAEVATYGASAVAIVAAILLVRWGLHAMGVLRPRG